MPPALFFHAHQICKEKLTMFFRSVAERQHFASKMSQNEAAPRVVAGLLPHQMWFLPII